MANSVLYGIRPVSGGQNNIKVLRFYCDGTNNSTALYIGDVVKAHSNGGVIASTAGAALNQVGAIVGIYDLNEVPIGSWAAAVGGRYLPASTVGYVDVALGLPDALFVGQSLATSYAATDVFTGVNLVATAGNTTLGRSGHNIGATGGGDFRLIGIVRNPLNAFGAVNCDMYISFMASIWGQGTGASI